ncbi:MAG: response regulator transcription factor [Bacteroidia bacterium]|nr:response regulator transcription factor [Bacteroidia bacterium]MBP9725254.1 response regulator transcription factor [Bacteroidia bacterium]
MTSASKVTPCNIVVVGEDDLSVQQLEKEVQKAGHSTLSSAYTIHSALKLAKELSPDLILIYFNLNNLEKWIEFAQHSTQKVGVPCVFVTNEINSNLVEQIVSKGFNHILTKPLIGAELKSAIAGLVSVKNNEQQFTEDLPMSAPRKKILQDCIFIKEGPSLVKVRYSEVQFLMSSHIYVHVNTLKKEFIVRASLTEYLTHFDQDLFIRVQRSYAVNIEFIEKITSSSVWIGNREIPMSQQYREELLNRINQ